MKKIIPFAFVLGVLCQCHNKAETVDFLPVGNNDLIHLSFQLPEDKIIDSIKDIHNRCMGVNFDPNVLLFKTDGYFIGNVINKNSGKIVAKSESLGISIANMFSQFSIKTTPCYTKNQFHLPLSSIVKNGLTIEFPGTDKNVGDQINKLISESDNGEIQIGSWIYIDMKEALKKIIDTSKSSEALNYKSALLDTSNLVLIAAESIMKIDFFVITKNGMSASIQSFLKTKPTAIVPNLPDLIKTTTRLYYINEHEFQVSIDGFFPIAGQLMKAKSN